MGLTEKQKLVLKGIGSWLDDESIVLLAGGGPRMSRGVQGAYLGINDRFWDTDYEYQSYFSYTFAINFY